jgi:hypothetical protein
VRVLESLMLLVSVNGKEWEQHVKRQGGKDGHPRAAVGMKVR